MNKTIKYSKNKLSITHTYDLTLEHLETLFLIQANDGYADFENRDPNLLVDVDGNELSWKTCDELVEMGLLLEDEESFDVYFELNDDAKEVMRQIALEH